MKRSRERKTANPDWQSAGIGIAVSLTATFLLTGVGTALIHWELAGEEWMNYLAAGILLLSAFLGGMISARGGLSAVAIEAGLYWILLVCAGTMLCGTVPAGTGAVLIPVLGGNVAAVLLALNRGRKPGKRHRRRRR